MRRTRLDKWIWGVGVLFMVSAGLWALSSKSDGIFVRGGGTFVTSNGASRVPQAREHSANTGTTETKKDRVVSTTINDLVDFPDRDRKSTRLNSSHHSISYA